MTTATISSAPAVVEHRHRVMASATHVVVVDGGPGAVTDAVDRLAELERRWSRFLVDSDISRLNRAHGRQLPVHPDTVVLVEAMVEGWVATAGRYDPTTLPRLVAAGYDASIDDPDLVTVLPDDVGAAPWQLLDVVVDRERCLVTLPPGLTLDPGGIGKGLAADMVVDELIAGGAAGALVGIGGDLAAAGTAPSDAGWLVAVEDPFDPSATLLTLAIASGGVCTSSTRSRRWRQDGAETHHLIDPSNGGVSPTDLAAVTVAAATACAAEVRATSALLLGSDHAIRELDGLGLAGLAVTERGECLESALLAATAPLGVGG